MLKRSLALLFAAGMAAAATEVSAQPTSAGTPPNESASKIPQAGNVNRYVIPLFTSQSTQATRSFVAIGVRNNGTPTAMW